MTYRRFFNYLLAASSLLLLGAWCYSLKHQPQVYACTSAHMLGFSLGNGSLTASVKSANGSLPYPRGLHFGNLEVPWDARGIFGEWRLGRTTDTPPWGFRPVAPRPSAATIHRASVPLWALWLVFITVTLVVFKRMERRSASGKERLLAEKSDSDRSTGNPS